MNTQPWIGDLRIANVRLRTADLPRLAKFYQESIGLERLPGEGGEIALAAPGGREPLLILAGGAALRHPPGTAGLYHLALRLPSHAALADAFRRLLLHQAALAGAESHGVSDAVYLRDPDGNGVEIYADLPRERWPWHGGQLAMSAEPLDLDALLAAAGANPPGGAVPRGIEIGHLHLHVAGLPEAERFFHGFLGLGITQRSFPGALFFAAPGYHHHIAANTWAGGGAPAPEGSAGLVAYRLLTSDAQTVAALRERAAAFGYPTAPSAAGESVIVRDPAGAWVEVAFRASVP